MITFRLTPFYNGNKVTVSFDNFSPIIDSIFFRPEKATDLVNSYE
jgi:hypothetical protein